MRLRAKDEIIRFRADKKHLDKVELMMVATGLGAAELMRRLIDNAQIAVVTRSEPVASLPTRGKEVTNAQAV